MVILCLNVVVNHVVSPKGATDPYMHTGGLKGRIVQPPKTGLKCTSAAAPTLQQTVACQSSPLRKLLRVS